MIFYLLIMVQKDTYKSTGCFDLTCKGFVQTNKNVALGAILAPISTPFGQQYEINVGIFQVIISSRHKCALTHIPMVLLILNKIILILILILISLNMFV